MDVECKAAQNPAAAIHRRLGDMDETQALASERKALAREVLRLQRSVTDLGNRVRVTRGASDLRLTLQTATADLQVARDKLAAFDRDLMGN